MANILLITRWTGGDVFPYMRLGIELLKKGHSVRLFSHCIYEETAKNYGLKFTAWDTYEEYKNMYNNMSLLRDPLKNPNDLKKFRSRYQGAKSRLCEIEKIKKHCKPKDTVIVGKCRSEVGAMHVSELLNIPYAAIYMAPSNLTYMLIFNDIFSNDLITEINALRTELSLPLINDWISYLCSPKLNLAFWPEWYGTKDIDSSMNIIPIGFPLHDESETGEIPLEIMEHINKTGSPILISAGTSTMINPDFYSLTALACEKINKPALLVTKHDKYLQKKFPSNVKWFPFLPFASLMPKMSAVVHHGGMGTLSRCLYSGKPQLVLAHLTDGPDNAIRLQKLNLANYIPPIKWSVDTIAENLLDIHKPENKKNILKYSQKLKSQNGILNCCEYIESIINNKDYAITSNNIITKKLDNHNLYSTGIKNNPLYKKIDKKSLITNILKKRKHERNKELINSK